MIQWAAIKALFMNKWVLIGGSILLALVVQQGRIWAKDRKIDKQDLAIAQYKNELAIVIDANEANYKTIAQFRAANEQCARANEVHLKTSKLEIESLNGRIRSSNKRYEELKNSTIPAMCAPMRINSDWLDRLQAADSHQD